ncbi:MAG: PaaI family thioesterase [Flavobacteriales bacterium]|nr:PaaI family thioesterase [Flavobacteriales bacterium]
MDILSLYNKNNHFGRFMEMNYEILKPGKVLYKLKIKEDLLATPTAAHGGAIAGFMDAIVGVAALSATIEDQKVVSTIEFKINYLRPGLLNEELTGIGEVLKKGKSLLVVKGEILNPRNEIIATALATMNAYPLEKSSFSRD